MAKKEITPEMIWNSDKMEGIKEIISAYKWIPFERYLIWLGSLSGDYSYSISLLYEHIEYFRKGWINQVNPYKMLELFSLHLDEKV